MTKNRRLTKASVYRYLQKRLQLAMSQQLKEELGTLQYGSPDAFKIALHTAYEETSNWATDQAIYHEARGVAKRVAEKYGVPGRLQGLLMAYAEKVLANFFIDRKGETLPNLVWEYARKILEYVPANANAPVVGYLKYDGKTVSVTELLRELTVEVAKLVGVSPSTTGGYLSGSHLHVV